VGQSSGFRQPTIVFYELDGLANFYGPPTGDGLLLLPGTDRSVDRSVYARNDSCLGRIRYGITFRLREYLYLE
jgi:hypothetical protein